MGVARASVVSMAVGFADLDLAALQEDAALMLDFRMELTSRVTRSAR
jgi:hypothetical protein